METNSLQRRAGLEEKVPELERTVKMVEMLTEKKENSESFETTFELSDTLYAKGVVDAVEEVYIWLGVRLPSLLAVVHAHSTAGRNDALVPTRRCSFATHGQAGRGEDRSREYQGRFGVVARSNHRHGGQRRKGV